MASSINGLYQNLLGRDADQAGLDYWKKELEGGMSMDGIASAIRQGDEHQSRSKPKSSGGLLSGQMTSTPANSAAPKKPASTNPSSTTSTSSAINDMYQGVLGRDAQQSGLDYWQGQIDNGMTMDGVSNAVKQGWEHQARQDQMDRQSQITGRENPYENTQVDRTGSVQRSNGSVDPYAVSNNLGISTQQLHEIPGWNDVKTMRDVNWDAVLSDSGGDPDRFRQIANNLRAQRSNTGLRADQVTDDLIQSGVRDEYGGTHYRFGNVGLVQRENASGRPFWNFATYSNEPGVDTGSKVTADTANVVDQAMRFGVDPQQLSGLADLLEQNGIDYQGEAGLDLRGLASKDGRALRYANDKAGKLGWQDLPYDTPEGMDRNRLLGFQQDNARGDLDAYRDWMTYGAPDAESASSYLLSDSEIQARRQAVEGPANQFDQFPQANTGGGAQSGGGDMLASQAWGGEVQPNETSQYQLNQMLDPDSPLMQRARSVADMGSNRRGLLRSSMAEEAAMGAMIDRAQPFAQQDSQTYFQNRQAGADRGMQDYLSRLGYQQQSGLNEQQYQNQRGLNKQSYGFDMGRMDREQQNRLEANRQGYGFDMNRLQASSTANAWGVMSNNVTDIVAQSMEGIANIQANSNISEENKTKMIDQITSMRDTDIKFQESLYKSLPQRLADTGLFPNL